MPIPSNIRDMSASAGSNFPQGTEPIGSNLDNYMRAYKSVIRQESNDYDWQKPEYTTSYLSGTTFSISGLDVTGIFQVNRRIRAVGSMTGTIYGTITASVFVVDTTITVAWDTGSLSSETLTMSLGMSYNNNAFPANIVTNAKMADNAINTAELVDNSVTTAKINTGLVTGLTAATDLQNADQLILADNSNSDQNRKITLANAKPYLTPITTRGDIIRGSSTGLAERLALGVVGSVPISDGSDVSFGFPTKAIIKNVDESRTGNTTQQWVADSSLIFTMSPNRTYLITLDISFLMSSAFEYGWDATGAVSSAYGNFQLNHGGYQDSTNYTSILSLQISETARFIGLPQYLSSLNSARAYSNLHAQMVVANSGSSNTFRFVWYQRSAVFAATVYAGSILTYQVIG